MSVTSIQYEEPDQDTYESVSVAFGQDKKKSFQTGDFVKDWYFKTKFILQELQDIEPLMNSSSVDHFIMDGDKYDSAYLYFNEKINEPELRFRDDNYNIPVCELFVKSGTSPTWHELRELVGDPKTEK